MYFYDRFTIKNLSFSTEQAANRINLMFLEETPFRNNLLRTIESTAF